MFEKVWYQWLGRPYRLAIGADTKAGGQPVVLLHGLGSSSQAWQHVLEELRPLPYRVVSFDLLGFGASPKPEWLKYTTDDHARMVIAALRASRLRGPVVLVGHSMGCLVAARVARLRPDLVKHLVLYEMPLYAGLPEKRRYRLRLNLYFKLYEQIIAYRPIFSGPGVGRAQRLAERLYGLHFTDRSWKPFVKSLKHTIMEQTAADDIKHIKVPIDVIYGTRDRLVIRGKTKALFGEDTVNITAHTVRASHKITKRASQFLVSRIQAAIDG